MQQSPHRSVLLKEALEALALREDGIYVDATFGAGGHSRAILAALGPLGKLVAFDVDPSVHARTDVPSDPRFILIRGNFRHLDAALQFRKLTSVDGVLFDLGVSSMQLDSASRGFGFTAAAKSDALLDMRMDSSQGISAAEYIAETSERELANVIHEYGEERHARKIARAIKRHQPRTTGEVARIVSAAVHVPGRRERIHPATRTFQALRIAVNDELGALEDGLEAATRMLRPGGRLVAISFHSLEDRIVKNKMRSDPRLRPLYKKPLVPTEQERAQNPRSRSAKLRAAERI